LKFVCFPFIFQSQESDGGANYILDVWIRSGWIPTLLPEPA